jgi:hypothetical protein
MYHLKLATTICFYITSIRSVTSDISITTTSLKTPQIRKDKEGRREEKLKRE